VVTFAVASGGGSVVGGGQVTDPTGTAAAGGWFLGNVPGPNTLTASAQGLQSVTFTATADAGLPVSLVAVSPTTQTAVAGATVTSPPSVVVRDVSGSPVAGVVVTFSVTAGGGSVVGSPATTNALGIATLASWTLGPLAGTNTVVASATGLPSATFSATGTAGLPATVVAFAGDNQAAVQGTAVTQQPTVKVTDSKGNPVAGIAVTFAVFAGGGSAVGLNQITDPVGLATVGGWTLGAGAPNTLRATVTGTSITGNPVNFTAQSATQIAISSASAGPITPGATVTITVQLQNASGVSVSLSGIPLTIAIATGAALNSTPTLPFTKTTTNGVVSFTFTHASGGGTARTFTVTGTGLFAATTTSITFN
jgi:adhesin/invasin